MGTRGLKRSLCPACWPERYRDGLNKKQGHWEALTTAEAERSKKNHRTDDLKGAPARIGCRHQPCSRPCP